ncbi:aspartyl-phosphate phosphatase Spo0E family protein [Alteribacillus bidgolensis]|uniref:aspartyl-phosphate phosphatase Spo0E family protein n=1 Tax=Alteribacillus bidgolensis TaxID=930129 RepID=UPI0024828BCC|nr:aspartyl-phosphate phosphatase Spo0E family protein [Alteribacillus bidgolensis]
MVLLSQITLKKKEMHRKADLYGLTDPRTVDSSQELDILLNEYQRIQTKSKKVCSILLKNFKGFGTLGLRPFKGNRL